MAELTGNPGFAPPRAEQTLSKRHVAALELIATVALTVSLVVAATAVSIGDRLLARGDVIAASVAADDRRRGNKPNPPITINRRRRVHKPIGSD